MMIFPAIDIKNQQCVRLKQGDFNQMKRYEVKPIEAAKAYQKKGAKWLHIIDLDGAQTGDNKNLSIIQEIARETKLKIQLGGGMRSKSKIKDSLSLGIERVIVGTFALDSFDELKDIVQIYPNRVIVSLDSKNGYITKHGWQETSSIKTMDFIKQLEDIGIKTVVVTDIAKDGMMQGPNFQQLQAINQATSMQVIASGGVSSLEDIKQLKEDGLYGAIIGKALYINQIDLKEAIQCSQDESFPV